MIVAVDFNPRNLNAEDTSVAERRLKTGYPPAVEMKFMSMFCDSQISHLGTAICCRIC